MSKQRAFIRYTKAGNIVPGSLILTNGTYPNGPGLWKEITTDLCCENNNTMNYKVYTALLTQEGTNPPTAIVLENTLGGDVVWSYIYVGAYSGTLIGAFPQDKTAMFITNTTWNNVSNAYIFSNGTGDAVSIETYNSANTATTNNILGYTTVEIRVYP